MTDSGARRSPARMAWTKSRLRVPSLVVGGLFAFVFLATLLSTVGPRYIAGFPNGQTLCSQSHTVTDLDRVGLGQDQQELATTSTCSTNSIPDVFFVTSLIAMIFFLLPEVVTLLPGLKVEVAGNRIETPDAMSGADGAAKSDVRAYEAAISARVPTADKKASKKVSRS